MSDEQKNYIDQGHILLRGLLQPEVAAAMTYQFQQLIKQVGPKTLAEPRVGHKQSYEVYGYSWPPMMTFLWGLTPRVEQIVGKPLLPTYSFFRTYQQGDVCRIHADRAACEHSLSLTLGLGDGKKWGLSMERDKLPKDQQLETRYEDDFGGKTYDTHEMAPGDGVFYHGIEHRHGRIEPNPNKWSAHMFLHWVEKHGPHAGNAFDGQTVWAPGDFTFPS
jgi:hypothetical protein